MRDTNALWLTPTAHPRLGPDGVHVWRASLLPPPPDLAALETLLTPEEIARADRFRFQGGRENFVHGRAVLRILLGRYLATPPGTLRFALGEHGKPYLAGSEPVRFNMSDSYGLALFAFALNREVGVDLERVRSDMSCERIAKRHFTANEYADLMAVPEAERTGAFFTAWTRKEAYLKAIGTGLYRPLDSFEVTLASHHPPELRLPDAERDNLRAWTLTPLHPGEEYRGALVVEGSNPRVACLQWN